MQEHDFNDTSNDETSTAVPAITPATVPPHQQLVNPLEHYVKSEGGGSAFFEGDYLNFNGQSGMRTLGADKEPIDADAQFLVNIHEIHVGWIRFVKDEKPRRENGHIVDGYQRKPRKELGDNDEEDCPGEVILGAVAPAVAWRSRGATAQRLAVPRLSHRRKRRSRLHGEPREDRTRRMWLVA